MDDETLQHSNIPAQPGPDPSRAPEQSLEAQVGAELRRRDFKLVAAESCTGGLIGHRITNVPGSSDYYLGSVTAYAYEAKQRLLGVSAATLAQHGAVSQEVVLEMARGARVALTGDFSVDQLVGVSVSGIAGPGGGLPHKPIGLVWIGLNAPGVERAWEYHFEGNRLEIKAQAAEQVLLNLLHYLRE